MPPNPAIPSPRQGECKDRSAMGLLGSALDLCHEIRDMSRRDSWESGYGRGVERIGECIHGGFVRAELHARNVDKQRRRLLAERLERDAEALQDSAMVARGWGKEAWAKYGQRHHARASKLRTIAARLRGTK